MNLAQRSLLSRVYRRVDPHAALSALRHCVRGERGPHSEHEIRRARGRARAAGYEPEALLSLVGELGRL